MALLPSSDRLGVLYPKRKQHYEEASYIGYARVSTVDQNLDAKIAALEAAGCNMIRTETPDGATLTGRPELGVILDFIHPGETLVVARIDRLGISEAEDGESRILAELVLGTAQQPLGPCPAHNAGSSHASADSFDATFTRRTGAGPGRKPNAQ